MPLVATLITDPSNPGLTPALGDAAARALNSDVDWLAEGIACDLPLDDGPGVVEAGQIVRAVLDDEPVDVVVQEARGRRKGLLLADMDSTMIRQECVDELAAEAGFGDRVAAITARAMNGEIDFEPALRERVALLGGLALSVVDEVLRNRIELASGGRALIATMRANGAYTALVSGGFTHFTGPVAAKLDFDEHRANVLHDDGASLSGTVQEPILGQQAKVDTLLQLCERHGLTPEDAIAVGDGANDLGMIRLAGSGVALHAKPVVAEQAGMRIDHGDLTSLLYIQGYRQSDFVWGST